MDNYFRKVWYPSVNPRKSQGINESGVEIDEGWAIKKHVMDAACHQKMHEIYRELQEDKYKSIDQPRFCTNCIETILDWLDNYDIILGMQFNFTHPDILRKLSQKNCQIIIQHHSWMDCADQRTNSGIKKNFLRAKKIYPLLNWKNNSAHQIDIVDALMAQADEALKDSEGGDLLAKLQKKGMGIGVFKHIPRENEYPSFMHHKFLVGMRLENGQINPKSVIYGSFNMSSAATNNLESILVWDENELLGMHLTVEHWLTCNTNQVTIWEDFVQTKEFIENDRDYPELHI